MIEVREYFKDRYQSMNRQRLQSINITTIIFNYSVFRLLFKKAINFLSRFFTTLIIYCSLAFFVFSNFSHFFVLKMITDNKLPIYTFLLDHTLNIYTYKVRTL